MEQQDSAGMRLRSKAESHFARTEAVQRQQLENNPSQAELRTWRTRHNLSKLSQSTRTCKNAAFYLRYHPKLFKGQIRLKLKHINKEKTKNVLNQTVRISMRNFHSWNDNASFAPRHIGTLSYAVATGRGLTRSLAETHARTFT